MLFKNYYEEIDHRLDLLYRLLYVTHQKVNTLMSTMQDLTSAITAETAEEQVLLDALSAAKATGNQAAIDAAVAAIEANTAKMQAAVNPVTPAP